MSVPLLGGEGLTKYCSWGAWYKDGHVSVPYVRKIATNGRRFAKLARFECGDTAELVRQFLEEYQVKLGHAYLLDTALGAYEGWGANNNGDAHYEQDLLLDSDDRGYRSFQKHAHVFRGHRNSDPSLSIGKVVLAAYNKDMKRVELIEELDCSRGGDILDQWESNGSLATSMGMKVAFDICSICNNRAPTVHQYCEHLKTAMGRTLDDGRHVHNRNPNPRFFDQSHVGKPADKIAGTMEKIAHVSFAGLEVPEVVPSAVYGILRNHLDEPVKVASESVPLTVIQEFAEAEASIPSSLIEDLATHPLHKVASTLVWLGIVPKPEEWQQLVLCSQGHSKLASDLRSRGVCFDPDMDCDAEIEEGDSVFGSIEHFDHRVGMKLASVIPQRSLLPFFLRPRMKAAEQVCHHEDCGRWGPDATPGTVHRHPYKEDLCCAARCAVSEDMKVAAEVRPPEKVRKGDPSIPATMAALGVSYGLMRAIQAGQKDAILASKEGLGINPIVSALLMAAGFAAALRMGSKAVSSVARPKVASLLDDEEFKEVIARPRWSKSASPKGLGQWVAETPNSVKHVVLPFGSGYMSSAYFRAKQMQGSPTNSAENLVADHPLAAGVGATGAVALARRVLKRKP